ncbi:fluoride efflux transporter CrcB [bacterium]|nr:fluoride efflux transporter CrcB [bacterium]
MLKNLIPYLLVALGGSAGAVARFATSAWIGNLSESRFPWGTFAVNIAGCFFLGFVGTMVAERLTDTPTIWRYAVAVGFLGSFTTFSTFKFETQGLLDDGAWILATLNVTLSIFIGLVAVRLGTLAARGLL